MILTLDSPQQFRTTYLYPACGDPYDGVPYHGGDSDHTQVDTGLGFTCDVEILRHVLAINEVGMKSIFSCQGGPSCRYLRGYRWGVKRRQLTFAGGDLSAESLMAFAIHLAQKLPSEGWIIEIRRVDRFLSAVMEWMATRDTDVLNAISSFPRRVTAA